MLHALTASLTALTLLAHSILGCCWHVHAAEASNAKGEASVSGIAMTRPASNPPRRSVCGHHHALPAAADESELPSAPDCPEPSCDHGECSFVAARSATWELLQVASPLSPAVLVDAETPLSGVNDRLRNTLSSFAWPVAASEARARACLQVWIL